MPTLDVEAVSSIQLDAPRYVLYGGKGGVGKTTMAAATALGSARTSTPTLVVSTDPAHSLSDTFDTTITATPSQIHDEFPLYAAEIDPDHAAADSPLIDSDEHPTDLGGFEDLLGGDLGLSGMLPGADEVAAMHQLMQYLHDDRFDRIVVDTAPTGHTLRLLELPDLMDSFVGRILTLKDRLGGMTDGLTGLFGASNDGPENDLTDLRSLQDQIEQLRTTLRDPTQTDFRIVLVPEELSVFESQRLEAQLDAYGIPVNTIVVNRVMEPLTNIVDIESPVVSPDLESCEFCQRRWKVQQQALRSAQDLFGKHTIKRVPLFADEVRGESTLNVVTACLED